MSVSNPEVPALGALGASPTEFLQLLQSEGRELARLTTRHASLEDVFVTLTGRHLREDEPAPK